MNITKGLVVADPWIGYLLDGTKTWEMRSKRVSFRGWFGLIRKGTSAVYGVARLVDVCPALSVQEMIDAYDKHRIPEEMIQSGEVSKWTTPWVLSDIRKLPRPISYNHPYGAVSWVELEVGVTDEIAAQLRLAGVGEGAKVVSADDVTLRTTREEIATALASPLQPAQERATRSEASNPVESFATADAPSTRASNIICEVEINEANLTNDHFYLRSFLHLFPSEIIGGSNTSQLARKEARIDWGGPEPAFSDIDGVRHKFFRRRGWIKRFYQLNRARPGDVVSIEEIGQFSYRVRLRHRA